MWSCDSVWAEPWPGKMSHAETHAEVGESLPWRLRIWKRDAKKDVMDGFG